MPSRPVTFFYPPLSRPALSWLPPRRCLVCPHCYACQRSSAKLWMETSLASVLATWDSSRPFRKTRKKKKIRPTSPAQVSLLTVEASPDQEVSNISFDRNVTARQSLARLVFVSFRGSSFGSGARIACGLLTGFSVLSPVDFQKNNVLELVISYCRNAR